MINIQNTKHLKMLLWAFEIICVGSIIYIIQISLPQICIVLYNFLYNASLSIINQGFINLY